MTATASVREYLDGRGFTYRITGSEATMNCPLCQDTERKFSINLDSGAWQCFHRNRCGKSGNLYLLQKELGDEPEQSYAKTFVKVYRKPDVKAHSLDAAAAAWFAGRKITQGTLDRFKVRQVEDGRIALPYFKAGTCVAVKYRRLPKTFSQEKDCEPVLYGRDLVPADAERLLIVEGELDALAAWEYGIVAVSVPGGAINTQWISTEWNFLKRFKGIDIALDGDPAGEDGVKAIQKRLGWDWDLSRVELPEKDLNDCLMKSIAVEAVKRCIEKARALRPEEIKLLRDIDFATVEAPDPGMACEIPGLTEKLGGWRLGELTIHGGESYAGKSTATMQEATGALRRFKRVCVCNLEQKLSSVVWTMVQQSGMNRADFVSCYADELVLLDLHGKVAVEKLLDLMRYVARRYGAQFFVIDSLGCLEIARDDHWLRQKETTAALAQFAKDADVHVHLVHHLRKPGKDKGVQVDHSDLEGSAWIRNLSDNVLLYRRIEDADRRQQANLDFVDEVVLVDKNRALGTGGSILLTFDSSTKRFETARER